MPQDRSVDNYFDNINWCGRTYNCGQDHFLIRGMMDCVKWRQWHESWYSSVSSDFSCLDFPTMIDCTSNCVLELFFPGYFTMVTGRETEIQSLPAMSMSQFLANGLKTNTETATMNIIMIWILRIPHRPVGWMLDPQMMVLFRGGSGNSGGKA